MLSFDSFYKDFGRHIMHFESLSTTQEYAKHIIDKANFINQAGIISCDIQTNGIGRKGNVWKSGHNIHCSMIVPFEMQDPFICIIVGCMVHMVLSKYSTDFALKWPNDIMLHNKKCGGILTEYYKQHLIIGIGINTTFHPNISTPVYDTTSIEAQTGRRVTHKHTIKEIDNLILTALQYYKQFGGEYFVNYYNKHISHSNILIKQYQQKQEEVQPIKIDNNGFLVAKVVAKCKNNSIVKTYSNL